LELLRRREENNPYGEYIQFLKQEAQKSRVDLEAEKNARAGAQEHIRELQQQLTTANKQVSCFFCLLSKYKTAQRLSARPLYFTAQRFKAARR